MNNYSNTPPKAVRAYTRYNLFFQLEREYILQTLLGHRPTISKTDILFDPTDRTYYQGPPLPSRYQNLILPYDWHLPGKTQRRKRVHRKTHGKIGFHELNERISSSWQVIDDEIRSFCTSLADIESIKYKKINKKTTTPKKSIVKKKTNIKAKRRNSVVETMISEKDFFPNNEEDDHIIDDLIASLDWSMDFPPTQDVLVSPTVSGEVHEDFNQSVTSIISNSSSIGSFNFSPVDMCDDEIINLWKTTPISNINQGEDNHITPAPISSSNNLLPTHQMCVEIPSSSSSLSQEEKSKRMSFIDDEYKRFKALGSNNIKIKRHGVTARQA